MPWETVIYDRNKLYEQVWSEAVTKVLLTKMSAKTAVGKSFDSRILSPPKKGAQDAIGVLVRHKRALSTTPLWLIEAPLKNICSA